MVLLPTLLHKFTRFYQIVFKLIVHNRPTAYAKRRQNLILNETKLIIVNFFNTVTAKQAINKDTTVSFMQPYCEMHTGGKNSCKSKCIIHLLKI